MMTATITGDIVAQLKQGKWFSELPFRLQQGLLDNATIRELAAGACLFARGDARCGLYAVLDGAIRISGCTAQGKESILTFIEPPNWMGEIALFDGGTRTHDAIAETHSTVLHVGQRHIDSFLEANPQYWKAMGQLVAQKLRLAFRAFEDLALLPASLRLTRRLIMIAEGYGELKERRHEKIRVPQEQLGMMLSISRQTTNQILKELVRKKLIRIAYGEIEILDLQGLKQEGQIVLQ